MDVKPAHKLVLSKAKGKLHASCVCGRQFGKFETSQEAVQRYRQHAGIKEK
jgi:hypothetical protein